MQISVTLGVFVLVAAATLTGCSTSKDEMLPAGDSNMLELWKGTDGESGPSRRGGARRPAPRPDR